MTYLEKIAAYEKAGGSAFLVRMFRKGHTQYNEQKLEEELGRLRPSEKPDKKNPPAPEYEAVWKPLYKEAAFLHARLDNPHTPGEQRREAVFAILNAFDEIHRVWYKQDHNIPLQDDTAPEGAESPLRAMRRISTLRTYASKAKKAGDTEKETEVNEEIEKMTVWLSLNSKT